MGALRRSVASDRPVPGARLRRRGRLLVAGAAVALTASGAAVVTSLPASAGVSTITAPRIVYTGVNQTIDFTGTDPISNEPRKIQMDATVSASCTPTSGNGWSVSDCGRVQMSLNDSTGGTLFLDGTTKVQSNPNVWKTASGAIIDGDNPTDPALRGGPVLSINMNGTLDQLNGALADVKYVPATDYEDRTYDEKNPPGPGTPTISILVNDGSGNATSATTSIVLRVEGPNGGPTLAAPPSALVASAGAENSYPASTSDPALFSVIDPELCLRAPNNRCGGAYDQAPAPVLPEPNDAMLLVMWLAEQDCGSFDLRSTVGFSNLGGSAGPGFNLVNSILTAPNGLDLEQDAANAILTSLGPTAAGLDLSKQTSGYTTVFAGTATDIEDVRYALSQLHYKAPAGDATCNLNIAFSDLGNNGMPTSWVAPDPQANPAVPEHEIPKALADTTSVTFDVKDTHPDLTISQVVPSKGGDPAGPNKPALFKITFSEPIDPASFDVNDLSLGTSDTVNAAFKAGTFAPIVPGSTYAVEVLATADGSIKLTTSAGAACAAGHYSGTTCETGYETEAPTYDDNEITWDQTGPTPSIAKKDTQANPTNGTSVTFELDADETFSSAPASITGSAFDLTASTATIGSPTVTWLGPTKPGKFDVVVPVSSSGDVVVKLKQGVYTDLALNPNDESATATVTVDRTKPTVTADAAPGQASPTSDSQIDFEVTFSEDVTDFAAEDVVVGGSAGGDVDSITGGPAVYTVTVTGMNQNGDVTLSVKNDAVVDAVGNPNTGTPAPAVVDYEVPADPAPTVSVAVKSGQADPVVDVDVDFTVTFSEAVTGFTSGTDVTVGGTSGAVSATITPVSSTVYTVTVTGMGADGTVTLDVPAGAAFDSANQPNEASAATAVANWKSSVADTTNPTVADIDRLQSNPTNASPVKWTVEWSETVTGFDATDISTVGSTAPGALVVQVTPSGPASLHTVSVSGMTGPGTVVIGFPAGAAEDLAGNPSEAPNDPDTSATFDNQAPTVTVNQAAAQADPTSGSTIVFDVVFSEDVTAFNAGDLAVTSTAGALSADVQGGPAAYTVTLTGMSQSGTVSLAIPAGAGQDQATNLSLASTSTDSTVTWNAPAQPDTTKPTVTINQGASQNDPTSALAIVFDVQFSEPVVGFATGDVTLGGTAGATTATVSGSGAGYTVTVTGMQQAGTVVATIAAGVATDGSANANLASTSTDDTVTWSPPAQPDTTAPTVTIEQSTTQADPTSGSAIVFDVVFSEPVLGFTTGDVTLGGTAGATTATVTGSGATYAVTVTGMQQTGTVTASIAAGKATDAALNPNEVSVSVDNTVQWNAPAQPDTTAPTVTVNQAAGQADPTSGSPILFTVVFSEPVIGFATGDVTLGGTAGATSAVVSGGPTTYTVTVTGMSTTGTVTASVAGGVATDGAGNPNAASTSTDSTVTWNAPAQPDTTAPTVTVNQAAGQADPTSTSPIVFTVVFSEPVTGFATGDVTLGGTAGATTATVSGGPTTYTVSVSGMAQTGTVTATVPAGVAVDGAANANVASTSTDNTVQWNAPANPQPGGSQAISTPGGTVTLTYPAGTSLTSFTSASPQVPPPAGVTFPYGQLSFTATTAPNALVTFTLTLPGSVNAFYKLFGQSWLSFAWDGETGAQINGNTISITIRDNGRGDSNPALGTISDPAAPAVVAGQLPGTGSDPVVPVTVGVLLLLAGLAVLQLSRRRQQA